MAYTKPTERIKTLDEFIYYFTQLKNEGFVETHRRGNTAIGKTLEDLLSIPENNDDEPDFGQYELKAKRLKTESLLTLFTKNPEPANGIKTLYENYAFHTPHYPDGLPVLHSTLSTKGFQTLGNTGKALKIELDRANKKLFFVDNNNNRPAYYSFDDNTRYLQSALYSKYPAFLVTAFADSKKENGKEYFHYKSAFLYREIRFDTFLDMIEAGKVVVDLRIGHYPDGSYHDHGTGFRIFKEDLPSLFTEYRQIV